MSGVFVYNFAALADDELQKVASKPTRQCTNISSVEVIVDNTRRMRPNPPVEGALIRYLARKLRSLGLGSQVADHMIGLSVGTYTNSACNILMLSYDPRIVTLSSL